MIDEERQKQMEEATFSEISGISEETRTKALEILTNDKNEEILTELPNLDTVKLCARAIMQGIACHDELRVRAVLEFKKNMTAYERKRETMIGRIGTAPTPEDLGMVSTRPSFLERIKGKLGFRR